MKVTVYTSPTCQPCRATKRTLDNAGLPYESVDLSAPAAADKLAEFKLKLGRDPLPMPVVEVDGVLAWTEFRPDLLTDLIQRSKETAQ